MFVKSSNETIYKFFQNPKMRKKWWPEGYKTSEASKSENNFSSNIFTVKTGYLDYLPIEISNKDSELSSQFKLNTITLDSTEILWETSIKASFNPLKRLIQYQHAKTLHSDFDTILKSFKQFIENDSQVYGLNIQFAKVIHPTLLTAKFTSQTYPSLQIIYGVINQLKSSVKANGALQVDSPMLNIEKKKENNYDVQVALPVNKSFKASGNQSIKMMVLGRILVTKVTGGPQKIDLAFASLEAYLNDKRLMSPAIPYQSLVTDRITEQDSNKWITKIYYPIY